MRSLLLAAALAAFVPAEAHAASWYRVGGNETTMSYVDLDSLRPLEGKIIALTQSVYADMLDGDVQSSMIRSEYDCAGGYFRTLEYTYFGSDQSNLGTEPSATINEHKVPLPDSLNEAMMEFICYRKGGEYVSDIYADARGQFAAF
jgi:hypothetical protein